MKNFSIGTLIFLISTSTFAEIPADIAKLAGRAGTFTFTSDGENNQGTDGTDCSIEIEKDEENGDSLHIDSEAYFETNVSLKGLKRTEKNGVATYQTNNATWSICGKYPLLSYNKTMIVTINSLSVKQVYYCLGDGWSSTTSIETCTLK
jgi:hypothetical protein